MPKLRLLCLALAALLAFASAGRAQELQPGTRVRITAPIVRGDSRFTGTVMQAPEDGRIHLRLDPSIAQDARDSISIPRNLIRRVEVSLGHTTGRSRREAAGTGALAGLAAGLGLGLAFGSRTTDQGAHNPWNTVAWTAPALAVVGAGTGALIGQGPHEVWRMVPLGAAGIPLGHNIRLAIRIGF